MFKRVLLRAASLSLLSVSLATAASAKEELMPQSQIKRGQKGICRTVFQGAEIKPFDFEILGNMKGMLGPGLDVYLAQLSGPDAGYTGVVSGMSGSPCYINGKLIGALSYRFGSFTKEPIAGITPIQDMLKIFEIPERNQTPVQKVYYPQSYAEAAEKMQLASGSVNFQGNPLTFQPIATPLTLSGIRPEIIKEYEPWLTKMGFHTMMGSSGGANGHPQAPKKLEMGGAIAGQMVRGDISMSGTGTVSYIDGNRVLAFGHPFFGTGHVQIPMATAYIHHILVSAMGSSKMAEDGREVGTITQDRLTAIAGINGLRTRMIPVQVNIKDATGVDLRQVNFEVFQDPGYTPMLMAMSIQNSLSDRLQFNTGGNIKADGKMQVNGKTLRINGFYSTTPQGKAPVLAARDLANTLFQLWNNPFEVPAIKNIQLNYTLAPETRVAAIEHVWSNRKEVRPGESINVHVRLKTFRNETVVRNLKVQVPSDVPYGPTALMVSDASVLNALENSIKSGYASYQELLTDLDQTREQDRMYLKWIVESPGISVDSQVYAKMPPSVIEQLDGVENQSSTVPLRRSPGTEYSLPTGYDLRGQRFLRVFVTPRGRIIN